MRHLALSLVAVTAGTFAASTARAEVTRCASAGTTLAYDASDLPDLSADTGWFPSDSAVELRITGSMSGLTHVAMGVTPVACWDASGAMSVHMQPTLATGELTSSYGADVHLFVAIHTSVLGEAIDWDGEIPVPYVGDLLLAGTTSFDPILLPDSPVNYVGVSDSTNAISLLSTNLLSAIIDITGISGGLGLNVQGAMTTEYWTNSLSVGDASVTSIDGTASVAAPTGDTLSVPISAAGTVRYEPSLVFSVAFQVSILGVNVVNITLADVSLPLPTLDRDVTLTADAVGLALPRLGAVPSSLDLTSGSAMLHLENTGAAPLQLELASGPAGLAFAPLTIDAHGSADVTLTGSDVSAPLVLTTNDPANGSVSIGLTADVPAGSDDDGNVGRAAGCSTSSSSSSLLVGVALLAIAGRRRRR